MDSLLIPIATALAAWWFSTGAILWIVHRARNTGPLWLAGATALGLFSLWAIVVAASDDSALGAYIGFGAALMVWGAIEVTFLTGAITGPNRAQCPVQTRGFKRFSLAAATLIHHEVLIVGSLGAIIAATWGQPNQSAALCFAILAIMRLSAKFNIFLGAPNLSEELMPEKLSHLRSYFRRSVFNPVFPLSILAGAAGASLCAGVALGAPAGSGESATGALTFALLVLALLEHVLMMTPLDDAVLWRWAARRAPASPHGVDAGADCVPNPATPSLPSSPSLSLPPKTLSLHPPSATLGAAYAPSSVPGGLG